MIFFNFCAMFLFELVEVWILDQPGGRGVRGWGENLEVRIVRKFWPFPHISYLSFFIQPQFETKVET